MDILLTVPPGFVEFAKNHPGVFPAVTAMYSDPTDAKLGSGGGTVNVLWKNYLSSEKRKAKSKILPPVRRIIIHSDGQSRRLPAYAPVGKSFIPFPVFRWGRGQRIDQTLLDIQLPLLEKILEKTPEGLNTLVASGDALVWTDSFTEKIPQADVVCIGIWSNPEIAARHGVFVCPRHNPSSLEYMLQKPSLKTLQELTGDFLYLLDAGIWLLSDRAIEILFNASGWDATKKQFKGKGPATYDLYSDFGLKLGNIHKSKHQLTVKILPLENAAFYHFGSNADLLASTSALHNRVLDQREIWHKKIKPNPDIFVQNSVTKIPFETGHSSIWIENSYIPETWRLNDHHIITGIPVNDWNLELPAGICLDFIPVGKTKCCIRPYRFNDLFEGKDAYESPLCPLLDETDLSEGFIQWFIGMVLNDGITASAGRYKTQWLGSPRLSSADIIKKANHSRLYSGRRKNLEASLTSMAGNRRQSIFYQLDLKHLAGEFLKAKLPLPARAGDDESVITRIHDLMFRSAYYGQRSKKTSTEMSNQAFGLLREGMLEKIRGVRLSPAIHLHHDQILWGRSPLRLDLAGGWTDTPPYCILYGGKVLNLAVELNGQPPIQVYIRPALKPEIVIHSIDLGFSEVVRSYADISAFTRVGSPFAIPKAALMLSGFHPAYSVKPYKSLKDQLKEAGGGLDVSLMVAVPKGSGLGTSSILAATLLGGLSECCSLGWDTYEVAYRTLLLEQMLTTPFAGRPTTCSAGMKHIRLCCFTIPGSPGLPSIFLPTL